jgi:hypothetical protein
MVILSHALIGNRPGMATVDIEEKSKASKEAAQGSGPAITVWSEESGHARQAAVML